MASERTALLRRASDGGAPNRVRQLPKLRASSLRKFLSSGSEREEDLECARLSFAARFVSAAVDGRDVETTDDVFQSKACARVLRHPVYRAVLLTAIMTHLAMPLWECSFSWPVIAAKLLINTTYAMHVLLEMASFGKQHFLDKVWGGVFALVAGVQIMTFIWSSLAYIRTRTIEHPCGIVRPGQFVRPFLLVSQMVTLRRVFSNVLRTVYRTKQTLALGVVVLVFYAVLAVGLFNNERVAGYEADNDNFDAFWPAVLSLYVLTTEENFPMVADPAFDQRPGVSYIFFISFILFFEIVVLPLILATVLDSYAHQHTAQIKRLRTKVRKALLVAYYVIDDDGVRGMSRGQFERLMALALPELDARRMEVMWLSLPKSVDGGNALGVTDFLELGDLLHRRLGNVVADGMPSPYASACGLDCVLEDEDILDALPSRPLTPELPPGVSMVTNPVSGMQKVPVALASPPPAAASAGGASAAAAAAAAAAALAATTKRGKSSAVPSAGYGGVLQPLSSPPPVSFSGRHTKNQQQQQQAAWPFDGPPTSDSRRPTATPSQRVARRVCRSAWFVVCVRLNTVLLACMSVLWNPQRQHRHDLCQEHPTAHPHSCAQFVLLHVTEGVLLAIFAAEMVLRAMAARGGWRGFLGDAWARADLTVAVLSVLGYVVAVWGHHVTLYVHRHHFLSDWLEVPRALRVLRIISVFDSLRTLASSLYDVASLIVQISLLYFCVTYAFAILGMSLVGDVTSDLIDERYSFTTFPRALLALFLLTVSNNWNDLLYPVVARTSPWVALYFVSYMLFCSTIMLDVLVGVVIEGFRVSNGGDSSTERRGDLWLSVAQGDGSVSGGGGRGGSASPVQDSFGVGSGSGANGANGNGSSPAPRVSTPIYRFRKVTEQDMFRHRLASDIADDEMGELENTLRAVETQLHERWKQRIILAEAQRRASGSAHGQPIELKGWARIRAIMRPGQGNRKGNGKCSTSLESHRRGSNGFNGTATTGENGCGSGGGGSNGLQEQELASQGKLQPVPVIRRTSNGPSEDRRWSPLQQGLDTEE